MRGFLKVPGITGTARHPKHVHWIDVFGFTLDTKRGSGPTAATFFKFTDVASAALFSAAMSGKLFAEVTFEAISTDGEGGVPLLGFRFEDAFVAAMQTGGRDPDMARPQEQLTISFKNMVPS